LVSQGTVEERVLSLHGKKRELYAAVLEGVDGALEADDALTVDALAALVEA
jgi:SNF2 family DNA or RNA helicase